MLHRDLLLQEITSDHIMIRGRRLVLADLVDRRLFDPDYITSLQESLANAKPFPHLVVSDWFNPVLLELIHEEFDLFPNADIRPLDTKRERTYRSQSTHFGPATNLYFSIINGGWFVNLLSSLTGVGGLVGDSGLYGGGLHESRKGGRFAIHRDFDRHPHTALYNEMVLLTYLNKDWQPEWQGALELWDASASTCVKMVQPEFGYTVLLKHGPASFHGHAAPLALPSDQVRRSVAAYYYSSRLGLADQWHRPTTFLSNDRADKLLLFCKGITPPILWRLLKSIASR